MNCRVAPLQWPLQLDDVAAKLAVYYQKVRQGTISDEFAFAFANIASLLQGGHPDHALAAYSSLASSASLDESGSHLVAVKSLINVVQTSQRSQ